MSSVHLYQAEKKDFDMIYEMLMEFKEGDLFDKKLPEVDKPKVTLFINTILEKGKVIFAKDLDKEELMGLCMFHKAEYWFSKDKIMNIHVLYVRKQYRTYNLVKTIVNSVKNVSEGLPMLLSISSGLHKDPVFERLGFENMGSKWRMF